MRLTSLLHVDSIVVGLQAREKKAALREILAALRARGRVRAEQEAPLLSLLVEREAETSTGIGQGMGYPHARYEGFDNVLVALATAREGLPYDSLDGEPVRLLIMLVVPPEKNALMFQMMRCVAELAKAPGLVDRLVAAKDSKALWAELEQAGLEIIEEVTAKHLMVKELETIDPDATLADAAARMNQTRLDMLPVVDSEGALVGEIDARLLFAASLPPYFDHVPTMRFVHGFDPFERFFKVQATRPVREVMREETHALAADTPLAEIVSRLASQDVPRLYIVDGKKLVGVIDRFTIINKVLCA